MTHFGFTTAAALAAAVAAGPVWAGFTQPTTCKGSMVFTDDAGSSTYNMTMRFDSTRYAIYATHVATGERTNDSGSCTTYFEEGCTHEIYDQLVFLPVDHFTFRLTPTSGNSYTYEETWADGSSARTTLSCAAD